MERMKPLGVLLVIFATIGVAVWLGNQVPEKKTDRPAPMAANGVFTLSHDERVKLANMVLEEDTTAKTDACYLRSRYQAVRFAVLQVLKSEGSDKVEWSETKFTEHEARMILRGAASNYALALDRVINTPGRPHSGPCYANLSDEDLEKELVNAYAIATS